MPPTFSEGARAGRYTPAIPKSMTTPMNEAAIRLHVEPLDEGGFLATSPDVPGLVAEGRSVTEAAETAQGLARKMAESCMEHGDPLPRALSESM